MELSLRAQTSCNAQKDIRRPYHRLPAQVREPATESCSSALVACIGWLTAHHKRRLCVNASEYMQAAPEAKQSRPSLGGTKHLQGPSPARSSFSPCQALHCPAIRKFTFCARAYLWYQAALRREDLNMQRMSLLTSQVEDCTRDVCELSTYHFRYRICNVHIRLPAFMRQGRLQRFCQQCGRCHELSEFEGNQRSCRAQLDRHNARYCISQTLYMCTICSPVICV